MTPAPVDFTLLDVPLPPSVNALYYKSKALTREHRSWREDFGWRCRAKKAPQFVGPYEVEIVLPQKMRGDADNRIKAVLDALVANHVTPDDRHCAKATARKSDVQFPGGGCMVIVRAVQEGRAAS